MCIRLIDVSIAIVDVLIVMFDVAGVWMHSFHSFVAKDKGHKTDRRGIQEA